jgi:hypothetical protein
MSNLSPEEVAARAIYSNTDYSTGDKADETRTETPQEKAASDVGHALFPTMRPDKSEPQQGEKPAVPENIAEMRKSDPVRQTYDITKHYGPEVGLEDALGDAADATPEMRAAAASEFKQIFADHGLSAQEAGNLVSIVRQVAKEPPSEEQQAKWIEQAERRLKEIYGSGMQQAVADARTLVARDPRVAKILEHTRLGNNPEVIELMARVARSERLKGRLGTIVKSEKTAAQSLFANSNMNP